MKKKIPNFKTEAEKRRFWQQHDSKDYLDWSEAECPSGKRAWKMIHDDVASVIQSEGRRADGYVSYSEQQVHHTVS
ncbi:MAG: CopG family antitoxin [Thermodesulfobacteriota bacterium]|nr:CopG family antitoxin [Thermodesulfobacteriota bacterium]